MPSPLAPGPGFAFSAVLTALMAVCGGARADETTDRQIHVRHPDDSISIQAALNAAYRKLRKADCQHLLDDFQDQEGRTLRTNLESFGVGPAEYLSLIRYRDGRDLESGRCGSGPAAVTHVGDRVVYVCGAHFRALSPGLRANTLIHEMLHSLGLGENPPSSRHINGQVVRRCGS
jgi:hypothetical protein